MRSEIENISDKLNALTVSRQETKDEGRLLKLTNALEIETEDSLKLISLKL